MLHQEIFADEMGRHKVTCKGWALPAYSVCNNKRTKPESPMGHLPVVRRRQTACTPKKIKPE